MGVEQFYFAIKNKLKTDITLDTALKNKQVTTIFDQLVKMDGSYLNHAMAVSLF